DLSQYGEVWQVGIAGNASRISDNILGNKQTVPYVQVAPEHVGALRNWMDERAKTSPWRPEIVQVGSNHYVALADVVYLRNPHSIVIAGASSLRDVSRRVPQELVHLQGVAHPIDEDGHWITEVWDLEGHGALQERMLALPDVLCHLLHLGATE